jgi:hypothetical protein
MVDLNPFHLVASVISILTICFPVALAGIVNKENYPLSQMTKMSTPIREENFERLAGFSSPMPMPKVNESV